MGDIHFKKYQNDFEQKYKDRVFYFVAETLKERNIKNIFQLGDFFNDRKNIDISVLMETKRILEKYFFNSKYDFTMVTLAGNHDVYHKNNNMVYSTKELLKEFKNLSCFNEVVDDLEHNSLIVPWINDSNVDEIVKEIETTDSNYCFGHFEINGFHKVKGFEETTGLSSKIFHKFNTVFSGHFHLTQQNQNIIYVGSLFQNDRNDMNDVKRIIILDTETGDIEEIKIPFELYHQIVINDASEMKLELLDTFEDKIVDVQFNIPRTLERENFIDSIISRDTYIHRIIDNSELCKEDIKIESNNEEVSELFQDYLGLSQEFDDKRKSSLSKLFLKSYEKVVEI